MPCPELLRARQNAFRDEAKPPPVRCPLRRGSFKRFNAAAGSRSPAHDGAADWRVVGGDQEQPCLDVGHPCEAAPFIKGADGLSLPPGYTGRWPWDGRMRDQNQESLA